MKRRLAEPKKTERIARAGLWRSGVIVVEVLVVTPFIIIMMLGLIEFGLILAELKQVALASRNAAVVASRQSPHDTFDINDIADAANYQLNNIGPTGTPASACRVILSETVDGTPTQTVWNPASPCNCTAPVTPSQPDDTVRVTVCVRLTALSPNLLLPFGFDLTGRIVESTTTMPYLP